MPYTVYPQQGDPTDYFGGFTATFMAKEGAGTEGLKKEIKNRTASIPINKPEEYNYIETGPVTFSELFAQQIMYDEDPAKSQRNVLLILISFISLFVLLPVLNLINLNISRIMDRSSEIGVRKAFGADTDNILFQFVFENIIQTFIGGLLGFIFALLAIYLINDSHLLKNIELTINLRFFVICFLISLFFGIISGLLPALKMSKLSIVNALKQNNI
jgi:putative ABC transport system permease protein